MRMCMRIAGIAGLAVTLCGCSRGDNKTGSVPTGSVPIGLISSSVAASAVSDDATRASANAKSMLEAMSKYMASQKAISFDYDSQLEIVTKQNQKLGLASSGAITLNRPDKIRVTRHGGFANVEFVFDGHTVKMLGKDANLYAQVDSPGTIDQLVDVLRDKYKRPVPGADLLMSNVYDQLIPEVVDAKDLGSGVIGGVECDHFAFRTKDVDWQIWIAQGNRPYPCRYVITSPNVNGSPQYTIDLRSWKTGEQVAADHFTLNIPAGARKLNPGELKDYDELPAIFAIVKESRGN